MLFYQFPPFILAVASSSSASGLRFPLTDSQDYLDIPVACYEEVETSSADSTLQSSIMLGGMLSIRLKHPFTPSLTPDSPLQGQPRLFAEDDYNLPPVLPYEAPFTSARSDCPISISSTDLLAPIPLSSSALASPLKPVKDIVLCASYSPGRPTSLAVTPTSGSTPSVIANLPLLHPSFYHLVSADILSSITDLDTKRLYYGPVASLVFTCRSDELVNGFGFPVPEIEVELKGVSDVSSLRGELSWGEDPAVAPEGENAGPATRSQTFGTRATFVTSVKATVALTKATLVLILSFFINMSTISFVLGPPRPSPPIPSGTPMSLSRVRSLIRNLPSPMRFRMANLNPDRGTVVNWIISRLFSSFMGFSVHDNSLMKVRCRFFYREYHYPGGVTSVKLHMSSKFHMSRLNAHRYYMGLGLLDSSNQEHSGTGRIAKKDIIPMLSGVPALPLEPFVVLDGLDDELIPPPEVLCFLI